MDLRYIRFLFASFLMFGLLGSSHGLQVFEGTVTLVEATYMPTRIVFQMSNGIYACPVGSFLIWENTATNNQSVYAGLLTAFASGKRVRFHINDNDTSCRGQFIHFIP
jgi:hypothetical protein